MPFTGSHPAAILPLLGGRLPSSALVIGTIVPDLPYYMSIQVTPGQTHSLAGVLGVDLILGVFVFIAWHMILVQPLVWISPAALQCRIPAKQRSGLDERLSTVRNLAWLCLALAIGGLTHVVLDRLTTADVWTVRHLSELDVGVLGLPLYRWLNIVMSLVGLAWLARYLTAWWRSAPLAGTADPVRPSLRWGAAGLGLGLATLAALIAVLGQLPIRSTLKGEEAFIAGLVAFFSTLVVWVILLAIAWHLTVGDRTASAQPDPGAP